MLQSNRQLQIILSIYRICIYLYITKYIYDKNARLNSIVDPMGNITVLARDANGRVTTKTDANGNATKYQYDALGRVTKQTDSNNGETTFAYDTKGNLAALTDPKNQTTRFEYDLANRMTKETRPMGQTIEYTYYANGLLKTVKDSSASGGAQTTTYTYDAANRLTQITYADGKQDTFAYDAIGNMTSYTKDSVSGTITYDALNRKLSETVNYGPFSKTYSYSYDALSNKASYTSPEGTVYNYTYNKNNQPTKLSTTHNSQLLTLNFDYQWDRLTKATLPSGISTNYAYDNNSRLKNILTHNSQLSTLNSYAYDFDKIGNIDKVTDNASLITDYSYDLTYQLTGAVYPPEAGKPNEEFTYDKTGNRLIAVLNSSTINYTHNANNELTAAGAIAYAYDANGNTVQETNPPQADKITKYIYNSSNRLERVELPDGRIAEYKYDPFGRRISKTISNSASADGHTTYYLYADEGLVGEYDSSGNLQKAYGWIPDSIWGTNPVFMLENNNYYFYHNDHLGTPQKMTDETGNIVWSATYTAFGEATVDAGSTITNNLRFAGQYFDEETGKHYNWNRYYDAKTGRYTQVDPIGFGAGDGNLYRYTQNRPTRLSDSAGLDSCMQITDWMPAEVISSPEKCRKRDKFIFDYTEERIWKLEDGVLTPPMGGKVAGKARTSGILCFCSWRLTGVEKIYDRRYFNEQAYFECKVKGKKGKERTYVELRLQENVEYGRWTVPSPASITKDPPLWYTSGQMTQGGCGCNDPDGGVYHEQVFRTRMREHNKKIKEMTLYE